MTRFLIILHAVVLFAIVGYIAQPSRADDNIPGVTAHRVAILFCYEHFNADDHAALGNLLAVEGNSPLSLADGEKFAARVQEICAIDPLSENCETPVGRMQACISSITLN